jgi:hypothetical protein
LTADVLQELLPLGGTIQATTIRNHAQQVGVDPTLLSPGAIFNPLAHHS